ncbi:DUF4226 domain-containing protein [Mycolicibacterium sp. P1-18]|uniref:DUF4226 domain-containing protein n=1 Tax=Mycolicibacterium sp. P1-18 TaxID=2024615 RepID=UPI0011F35ED6|nr:DUF4226 domain-containing protein [Mycolicibacterium sp. P1-18]KAA0093560.1 DUF4226 domain-containing protein [Mycolicibacterium sp. P1-18]
MTTRTFDDLTFWHHLQPVTVGGGWDPGWRPSEGAFSPNIARADAYWGEVLQRARRAYGDPNMGFNTDDPGQDRYLVFGDGTRVPADGSLAYHDSASGTTYLLNTDGSVSPVAPNGHAGDPIQPVGLRRGADGGWAPVDATGHQVAPLLPAPTAAPYGHHDENGVLTPKNAAGDYYVLGPDGRRFFDRDGHPIDEARFTADGKPGAAPGPSLLPTGEQQSGQAAEAVKKLQDELRGNYGTLSAAEERLSEAMLTAHATTADGREELGAIQHDIVAAVNDPSSTLDTPAGQQAYLKFLQGKVAAIRKVVDSGTLAADDQAAVATALAGLYADGAGSVPPPPSVSVPAVAPAPPPAAPEPAPADPGLAGADPGLAGADLGPLPPMPDPTLSDVLGGPLGGLGGDPMSSMASMLPGALGGLGGGDPFGVGGLTGAASPLAGLASALRDPPDTDDRGNDGHDDDAHRHDDDKPDRDAADASPPAAAPTPSEGTVGDPPAPQPQGDPGQGAPPAAPGAAAVPTSTVALPDGSDTTAKTPALAGAVRAYLSGTAVDEAYRQAGMALPPPGTPVTTPADPAQLSCGYLGMFTDHYVVAASAVKAIQDGQVVPLSEVASSPNFLGWLDPTTLAAMQPKPADPPPGSAVPVS